MTLAPVIQVEQTFQRRVVEIHVISVWHFKLQLPKRVPGSRELHDRTILNYHVVTPQVARIGSELWQDLRRCNPTWNVPGGVEQHALDAGLQLGGVPAPAADDNAGREYRGIVAKEI